MNTTGTIRGAIEDQPGHYLKVPMLFDGHVPDVPALVCVASRQIGPQFTDRYFVCINTSPLTYRERGICTGTVITLDKKHE